MVNTYKYDFQSVLKSKRTCDKAEFKTRTSSSRSTAVLLLNGKVCLGPIKGLRSLEA